MYKICYRKLFYARVTNIVAAIKDSQREALVDNAVPTFANKVHGVP